MTAPLISLPLAFRRARIYNQATKKPGHHFSNETRVITVFNIDSPP